MTHAALIDHRTLYRLPWTLPDNAISWLEPTSACDLACDGCYRENLAGSHKPLPQVRKEIAAFRRLRNSDGISIAGGDPLMHPDIVEIVRTVHELGMKPILNTNGGRLSLPLLRELKKAGAYGFTFHIDSKQGRPGWKGKSEVELNALRLEYARMLDEVGGLTCSFNSTVYEDTLADVPELLDWAAKHIDIVHVMVFILYRAAVPQTPFDWYAGAKKVDMDALVYSEPGERRVDMKAPEVVAEIRKRFPDFTPSAYLNGTEQPDTFKWLLTGRVGTTERVYGYVGPRYMEIMQAGHHLGTGKYLAYATPKLMSKGRTMLLLSPFDDGVRSIAKRWAGSLLANPIRLFRKMHFQSVMIIQPVDFLENGAQNMCDGCPDMTMWNGELVWSCRMEELKHFGCWVRTVPRDGANVPAAS
ncbi:MAG TPA: radical SAM protein [Thermoanaerobaculia bacterium]|nr:radical SAM protein [Thermoanaerobaculia bacterium]